GGLLFGNRTLGSEVLGGDAVGVQGLGLGRGDVHGQVLADLFGAGVFHQHADAPAVHVASQRVGRLDALETTHSDVFADFADQGGTRRLDGTVAQRQCRQGSHVSRVLGGDQFGQLVDECDEIVVLG